MASFEERKKKEANSNFIDYQEKMPRGNVKPTVQIYTPGSGRLRKTEKSSEDYNSENGRRSFKNNSDGRFNRNEAIEEATDRMSELSTNSRKRNKKPEQAFFVPTPVAKARESEQRDQQTTMSRYDSDRSLSSFNGNGHNNVDRNRSKRYSIRKYNHEDEDTHEDRRNMSPPRNYRQGSEPRSTPAPSSNLNRTRDTRSVEPQQNMINRNYNNENRNYNNDKYQRKPPSGRRHSTVGVESEKRTKCHQKFENLPPRFQKMYLLDNNPSPIQTAPVEDTWDGSSITFQGTAQNIYQTKTYPHNFTQPHNPNYYSTLPHTKFRGRGRTRQDYQHPGRSFRNNSPDTSFANSPVNSRPSTPILSRKSSVESLHQTYGSRSQTPTRVPRNDNFRKCNNDHESNRVGSDISQVSRVEKEAVTPRGLRPSLEAQLSPVSPPTPTNETVKTENTGNNTNWDWSEEVEQHVKDLESEALSDALTRSSSVTSLVDNSTKTFPSKPRSGQKKKKNKRSGRDRDRSTDKRNQHSRRQDHQNKTDQNIFKTPEYSRNRRSSRERRDRDKSFERKRGSHNHSRESSFDRARKSSNSEHENWREEIERTRGYVEKRDLVIKRDLMSKDCKSDVKKGGIIHLPQPAKDKSKPPVLNLPERQKYVGNQRNMSVQKTLFDPNNPDKPILINKPDTRVSCPGFSESSGASPPQLNAGNQYPGNHPSWQNHQSENCKPYRFHALLSDVRAVDMQLQELMSSGSFLKDWDRVVTLRTFLMESLNFLLRNDLKFSETENIDMYFWRILYYNIIETMRNAIIKEPYDNVNKEHFKQFLLCLIEEGLKFYDSLLNSLETTFKFSLSDFVGSNYFHTASGFVGLALVSAQKIFIYQGDLWRYREMVNETTNYGKSRQLYLKALEINPKNGRPYNQLALLAVYSKKKLDAVYYYMRSLMSANPVQSAYESLISLFEENRKKYESNERKKREERLEKEKQYMKETESQRDKNKQTSLRKETWIRPDGGQRVHRTTRALQDVKLCDSEEEDLLSLTSVEVNKRFVTSYLHVLGKLINKTGMESFYEAALQMLKEFRALLQHSPIPLPSTRFLQLLALNMFAIESTQLKDPQLQSQSGYRSEPQERALVVSLQMFNLILEKCISLLNDHIQSNAENINSIPHDAQELLPSINVWCDWMLCHTHIWNPPPSTQDFKVGPSGDPWTRIAALINLLDKLDQSVMKTLITKPTEGYEQVRLPEDGTLCGFTPLIYNVQEPTFVSKETDMEAAQFALRLKKLLFFGTVLCGLDQPVLKVEFHIDKSKYASVVSSNSNRSESSSPIEYNVKDLLVERFSDDDDDNVCKVVSDKPLDEASTETKALLNRKVELEKWHRDLEIHRQAVEKILQQSVVTIHLEIKPKNLVPDTNCFIDYLSMLIKIAQSNVYTLMVPLIVLNELEGLSKGSKSMPVAPKSINDPLHVIKVAEAAKAALEFLSNKNSCIKCITTKGTILPSTVFMKEDDSVDMENMTNDDKILATCMTLCKEISEHSIDTPRKLYRDVVLLTDDRNLRVKALAMDVPVREVPNFLQWAGLG